ncbi:DUF5320 domain-containing protein [Salinispira pacifica]|uniref:Uncharacterized protein n=1 Tax=Salinispira pacifica TaxID=1307761 RepID=V5WIP2_9SPIO|nr:DUF5320 domain-containing protein [Salinispira pacifica]AHC15658.1 hypothetical protein L21SP2_2301 [Salinispira pacifica]
MNGNRRGPENAGPGTGRGLGLCSGYEQPGCMNEEKERLGLGRRAGYGRSRGGPSGMGRKFENRRGRRFDRRGSRFHDWRRT